jgi:hypothetical protein
MLPRELYMPPAGKDLCQMCCVSYAGGDLTREEILCTETEGRSDAPTDHLRRVSHDNGRTWSTPLSIEDTVNRQLDGGGIADSCGAGMFDPRLGILYQVRLRRIWPGMKLYTYNWANHEHSFNDHTFIVENHSVEKMLRYEDGPDYDPDRPFDPAFCNANRAYPGTSIAFARDGSAYYGIVCYRQGKEYSFNRGGVRLMRRDPATRAWTASSPQFVAPDVSSRGMLEPDVAVLKNGHLLVVCRGSDTAVTPGRKWMTVSTDGGRTLSPIEEFRYDDGSQFYSPSSIHHFFRSSRNGVLYWLANITPEPPRANGPRYPLYIAEIDEDKLAVRKDGLLLVDDRREGDGPGLQLSNFSIVENRESGDIEIYLTRLGEHPERFWEAGVHRYLFSPPR